MAENTTLMLHPLESNVGKRVGRELRMQLMRWLIAFDTADAMRHFKIARITFTRVDVTLIL